MSVSYILMPPAESQLCRRTLEGPAFSPFRMSFWKPDPNEEEGGKRPLGEVRLSDFVFAINIGRVDCEYPSNLLRKPSLGCVNPHLPDTRAAA